MKEFGLSRGHVPGAPLGSATDYIWYWTRCLRSLYMYRLHVRLCHHLNLHYQNSLVLHICATYNFLRYQFWDHVPYFVLSLFAAFFVFMLRYRSLGNF